MGYNFKTKGGYWSPKNKGTAKWTDIDGNFIKNLDIYPDDVFTRQGPRSYTIITGVCIRGLEIDDELMEFHEDDIELRMTNLTELFGGKKMVI